MHKIFAGRPASPLGPSISFITLFFCLSSFASEAPSKVTQEPAFSTVGLATPLMQSEAIAPAPEREEEFSEDTNLVYGLGGFFTVTATLISLSTFILIGLESEPSTCNPMTIAGYLLPQARECKSPGPWIFLTCSIPALAGTATILYFILTRELSL